MITSQSYFWLNILAIAVGTLMIRGSLIALSQKVRINERTKEIFSFIPAAILPAFIGPAVFFHQGQVSWLYEKERLVVLALATVVCYFFRNTLITVVFGLATLYLITTFT